MKFHLTIKSFDHITGPEEIARMREMIGKKMEQFRQSDAMLEGGVFMEKRTAYFVLESDSEEELFDLIAPIQDWAEIEMHPLVSLERVKEFFERSKEYQESLN